MALPERPSSIGDRSGAAAAAAALAEGVLGKGEVAHHHDEVETVTLLRGGHALGPAHEHEHVHTSTTSGDHDRPHTHEHPNLNLHMPKEPITSRASHPLPLPPPPSLDEPTISAALSQLPKESVYRVKGFIRFAPAAAAAAAAAASDDAKEEGPPPQWWILNWAFGRWELVHCAPAALPAAITAGADEDERGVVRLTVMGERGEVRRYAKRLAEALGATVVA